MGATVCGWFSGTTRRSCRRRSWTSSSERWISQGQTTSWASRSRSAARVIKDLPWAFFWSKYRGQPGAASKAEAWQILSPVRAGLVGVDALNRMIQARFAPKVRELAEAEGWGRKVPRPVGRQSMLYGDKVINVVNQRRRDVWPKPEGEAYIANGDIGIVVGQYKTTEVQGAAVEARGRVRRPARPQVRLLSRRVRRRGQATRSSSPTA